MTWASPWSFRDSFVGGETRRALQSLRANEQCFIRKGHECGKICGGSKSCFIACPTDDELEPILGLISEKLSKAGIEAIIAVKERAYGQDIFCTKICGKIIESQFCIVILDDAVTKQCNVPNPNVYYEYGLMTALGKHIVPLQKENLELAFNIQSYDTIKYSPKNVATELERAIKDAIKLADSSVEQPRLDAISDRTIRRALELADFAPTTEKWFLADVISDTEYRGFANTSAGRYVYLAKVDNEQDARSCIEDLRIVVYRTEKRLDQLNQEIQNLTATKGELAERRLEADPGGLRLDIDIPRSSRGARWEDRAREIDSQLFTRSEWMRRAAVLYVGFIIAPGIDSARFLASAEDAIGEHSRYRLTHDENGMIAFDDIAVILSAPSV